jgi:hypothetical protein
VKIRATTGGGHGIGRKGVQARAKAGLGGIGMLGGVHQPVAIGGPTAEIAALQGGLGAHRGAHARLDAHPLALGHAAEQGHRQVVRLGAGVDRPADLRTHSSTSKCSKMG